MVSNLETRSSLERDAKEGESPVEVSRKEIVFFPEYSPLDSGLEDGSHRLPILNIVWSPIANKYREGKLKRTRDRE